MFILNQLRHELLRSKAIDHNARESSNEVRKLYADIDQKYNLIAEQDKLERIPHVRKSIVKSFLEDLDDVRKRLNDNYRGHHSKSTMQRFLNKLCPEEHVSQSQK